MSKQGSSRKSLIIGIIAAVVILAVLLVLLLTQCIGANEGANSETVQTTAPVDEVPTYDLYWNVDRAQYDGKSEAGMSSRNPESDGYFHVRFFKDGEMLDLKVADRKTVNAIEVNDVMGLVFDEEGIVIGVTSIDDMPLEQVGWQFYVQSIGGKLLKLNSSKAFNGLEVMLDIHDFTGIWDMTGLEGEVGMDITPISGDRVIAIANLAGELTHVYVYERPEFMQTFEAECIHCKKTVEWKMWNKENALPSKTGHYQLQNNISGLTKQQYIEEDQKVCLDLNGMQVDGKQDARVYTLHYSGAQLAIMDTSEGQKGVLKGHSTKSDQGGVVWVRYGQFHLYSGTLDGSDMICKLNGAAIDIPKGAYFYMHGGRIIGGNAKAVQNAKGAWTNGLGGAVVVRGKFVMNDGVIEGGKATGVVTKRDASGQPSTYSRGFGGNIYVGSGGEFEMNGGVIKNGTATYAGANVYVDGTGNFTMNDGVISGGRLTGKGRNGGNVFVSSKSTMTMNGGSILNGVCYNCGANLYLNGKVVMNGGVIADGKVYKWGTKTVNETEDRTNVFSVQGDFYMYGGRIAGGFLAVDTAVDKNPTVVLLSGYATIVADEKSKFNDMTISAGGDGVTVYVGNLYDSARIGVNTSVGIFTQPTKEANVDNFFSNIDDAEICYVDGRIGLGRFGCICGNNDKGDHFGKCDGTQLFWAPLTTTTLPTTTGNYYLPRVKDASGNLVPRTIVAKTQASMAENADIAIDLNGGIIEGQKNYRIYSLHNLGTHLAITDSSEAKTGALKPMGQGSSQGNAVWTRYGEFDFYAGTLDGSGYTLHPNWNVGTDAIPGTKDDKSEGRDGGTLAMSTGTVMNMYGGTVIGNKMHALTLTKTYKETVTETQIVDGKETEVETTVTKEVTRNMPTSNGASLTVGKNSVFNMYAGTIKGGTTQGYGGNVYIGNTGIMNVYDGTITEGVAGPTNNAGDKAGWGGNICIADTGALNIDGENVVISNGTSGGNGGNIYIRSVGATLNLKQGTVIGGESVKDQGGNIFSSGNMNLLGGLVTGGKALNGGNIAINSAGEGLLDGVVVENGKVSGVGGNIRISTTNNSGQTTITGKTLITGGQAKQGGNIALQTNNYNGNNPVATLNVTGGTIEKGFATAEGGNIYVSNADADCTSVITVTGGTVAEGQAKSSGGNIYVTANAKLLLNGGTVQNGLAGKGGKVEGATDNGWGGNVYAYGYVEINGATVSGGISGGNGGSIYLNSSAELLMTSGLITGGKTTADQGGNIFCAGKMQLLGGTVTKGRTEANKNAGNIGINSSKEVVLKNVTVSDGYSAKTGGNIGISSTAKTANITIGEGTLITGGTAGSNGGNLYISPNNANNSNPSVYVTVTGATIEKGTATGEGGNICVGASGTGDSQLTITDTTITEGTAKTGGNIRVAAGAVVTVDGEKSLIEKGATNNSGHGGNVNVAGTFILKDGAVQNGTSVNTAGNIYASGSGKVVVEGGKVLGGTDKNGANGNSSNMYFVDANLELRGGQIDGGVALINYNGNNATIKISGAPIVKSEDRTGITLTYASKGTKIPVAEIDGIMESPAEIYINCTKEDVGKFTTATEEAYAEFFHSNDAVKQIGYVDGCVALGLYRCQCNQEIHKPGCTEETLFWIPWSSTTSLPTTTGNYYINPNVTITVGTHQTISTDAKINLDLNGRTVKTKDGAAHRVYKLDAVNAELSISDTVGTGKIVSTATYDQGCVFWFTQEHTKVNAIDIEIDASGLTSRGSAAMGGNAICMDKAYSEFNMYGGKLLGGKTAYGGGAIYGSNWASVVRLSDGAEVIGHAEETYPAIRLAGTKNVISDATVTGGVELTSFRFDKDTTKSTSQLTLNAGANVDRIVLSDINDGRTSSGSYFILPLITVNGKLADGVEIEVTTQNDTPHVYSANAVDAENEDNFYSGSNKLIAWRNDAGKLELVANDDPTFHCICGSTGKHQQGCDGKFVRWTEWTDELAKAQNGTSATASNSLPKKVNGYYYLSKNVEITGQEKIEFENFNIALDLNGKTISNKAGSNSVRLYVMSKVGTLTLTDCSADQTGKMVHTGAYDQGMAVWVNAANAVFNMYNLTIDLSDATYALKDGAPKYVYGGNAVCVSSGWSKANLYSGTIIGANSANGGGALLTTGGASQIFIYDADVIGNENDENAAIVNIGILRFFGGSVTGGIVSSDKNNGGSDGLWLSGSPKIDYIKFVDEKKDANDTSALQILPITVNSDLKLEKPIALYSTLDGVAVLPGADVTLDETALELFSGQTHAIVLKDGKLELVSGENVYCVCGSSTEEHADGCDGTKYVWTELTDVLDLGTPGNYYLSKNMTASTDVGFKEGATRLNLNGYTITDTSNRFATTDGATNAKVTVTDTYTGEKTTDRPGGTLITTAATYPDAGAGILVKGEGCELNWLNATLDASKTTVTKVGGAGVCVEAGTVFNLYSGTITGGTSGGVHGGNIAIKGTMNMYGGTVTKGKTTKTTANGHGGNIALLNAKAVLNMTGGEVTNGNGVQWAGNIYLFPGTFNMSGGTVKNGTINGAPNNMGANITMRGGAVINMKGGIIQGRVTGASTGVKTLNFSGSAKIPGDIANVSGNNVSVAVTVNIGKVNEDAVIGFQYSAPSGTATDAETLLTNNKLFLANVNDPDSYDMSMSGFSAYLENDQYKRSYELYIEDGKLYAKQSSRTLK